MKTCVICISKSAHSTIDDWVNYYIGLGFTHIFLFDNNDYDDRYKIYNEQVTIIPYDSNYPMQQHNKTDEWRQSLLTKMAILMAFDQDFDYCFICDDDEYLDFKNNYCNVDDFLSKYSEYDSISIPWECMSDNGYIYIKDEPPHNNLREIYGKTGWKHFECKSFYKLSNKNFDNIKESVLNNYTAYIMHNVTDNNRLKLDNIDDVSVKHYPTYCLERFLLKKSSYKGDNHWLDNKFLKYYSQFSTLNRDKLKAYVKLCDRYGIPISDDDLAIFKEHNLDVDTLRTENRKDQIKLSDYFDKIFIIGALNSPKVNHTIERLKSLGLYDKNVIVHLYTPMDDISVKFDMPNDLNQRTPDRMSLFLAQYTIIKQSFDAGLNKILMLEDDNYFLKNIDKWDEVLSNMPKDWDVMKFTGFKFHFDETDEPSDKPLTLTKDLMYNRIFRKIDFNKDDDKYWVCSMSAIGFNRKAMEVFIKNQERKFIQGDNGAIKQCVIDGKLVKCNIYMPIIPLFVPIDDIKKYNCGYYVKYNKNDYN